MYVNDDGLPGPSNFLESAENGQVSLESTASTMYYVGIYGIEDCVYSVVVTDQSNGVIHL